MWRTLLRLLEKWACHHKWTQHHETKSYENNRSKRPYKIEQTLICSECGKIKKIEV